MAGMRQLARLALRGWWLLLAGTGCVRGGFPLPSRVDGSRADSPRATDAGPDLPDLGPVVGYRLATSSTNAADECGTATVVRDLLPVSAPQPDGPLTRHDRNNGTLRFCTGPLASGSVLDPGPAVLAAYFDKVQGAGSDCTVTVELSSGGKALGSGKLTLVASAPLELRPIRFLTAGATLAAGARLGVGLSWEAVKACNDTRLHYGAAAAPSSLFVPLR